MTQTDGEIYHVRRSEEINTVKMSVLPKAIYRFNAIPTNSIFQRTRTNNFTICMETQKNHEWPKQSGERKELEESTCLTSGYTTKQQSSDSMVLTQRQKHRSMEQNRKPRDKSTHLWTPYL